MRKNSILLIVSTIFLVGLDLLSKYIFYNLKYLEHISLIWPALNKGISRSLPVPFFITITISIIGVGIFIRLFATRKLGRIISAALIGGTIGNLIDRLIYGGVRDFINIGLFNFPIFNFADILLNIGIIGLLIQIFFLEKKEK